MKKILMAIVAGTAIAAFAAPPMPPKAAMKQHKAQAHMAHQQQKAAMHQQKAAVHAMQQQQKAQAHMAHQQQKAVMHQQKAAVHAMHQQQKAQAHMMHEQAKFQQKILRAGGRAAMRGPRFANGYHVAPTDFHGWRRGHRPHAHYRNVWMDDIWYDAYGYPCYSPYYQEVVMLPADTVVYTPGAYVAPAPVVVPPPVVAPVPVVVPPPVVVTPPPPPPTKTERVLHAIFGP